MERHYPVIVGEDRRQFGQVLWRMNQASVARELMAAYDNRRECLLAAKHIGLRVRQSGAWALAFWENNTLTHWEYVCKIAEPFSGVKVVESGAMVVVWFARQNAQATFDVMYCAKPGRGGRTVKVGTLTVQLRLRPSGAYSRTVTYSAFVSASGKVLAVLREAERLGTVTRSTGGYLANAPEIIADQLRHHGLEALGLWRDEDRQGRFALRRR